MSGPKQTWLKENQTRAVEFSRNNRSSLTSHCGLFRRRRLRFRFVVSLLYQVFRTPPNRRFVVFLVGVKPVSRFASVFPWKRLPKPSRLGAVLEPTRLRGRKDVAGPGPVPSRPEGRSPSRSDSFKYREGGGRRQAGARYARQPRGPGPCRPCRAACTGPCDVRGPHTGSALLRRLLFRQRASCPEGSCSKPAGPVLLVPCLFHTPAPAVLVGAQRAQRARDQETAGPCPGTGTRRYPGTAAGRWSTPARQAGRQPLRTRPPMLRLPLRSTTKRPWSTSSALSTASTSVTLTLFT